MADWKRELHDALVNAEKIAAAGGAYGMAQRLAKMAEPFAASLADDDVADIVAEAAGVKRAPEDVCIVHVPAHWIEGLRAKAEIPLKA